MEPIFCRATQATEWVSNSIQRYVIVAAEANSGNPLKGDFEQMARRRFHNPKPKWRRNSLRRSIGGDYSVMRPTSRVACPKIPLSSCLSLC